MAINSGITTFVWVVRQNLTLIRVLTRKTVRLTIILWRQTVTNILVGQIQLIYSQKIMKPHCEFHSWKKFTTLLPSSALLDSISCFLNCLSINCFIFSDIELYGHFAHICMSHVHWNYNFCPSMMWSMCQRWDNLISHKKIAQRNSCDEWTLTNMIIYLGLMFPVTMTSKRGKS